MGNVRITSVCGFCRHHNSDPVLEFNFADGKIYYICPECKKENVYKFPKGNRPFPRTRVGL